MLKRVVGKVQADDRQQHTGDKNQWSAVFHQDQTEENWVASRFKFMFSEHQARDGGTTARQLSRARSEGQNDSRKSGSRRREEAEVNWRKNPSPHVGGYPF